MGKTILVIAAHADDEVLGCGGAIARHSSEGDEVHVIFMTDGVSSRKNHSTEKRNTRNIERDEALKVLGVSKYYVLDYPDNKMDSIPLLSIIKSLEDIIAKIRPIRVYTHHHSDLNIDHRITHQAVMTACRPLPDASVREIFAFEVLSSTEWSIGGLSLFTPNFFIDITDFISVKDCALSAYISEMRNPPHSRSIEHVKNLAQHRGYSVGLKYAEGFELIRLIN